MRCLGQRQISLMVLGTLGPEGLGAGKSPPPLHGSNAAAGAR